jgi:hypothetical protein
MAGHRAGHFSRTDPLDLKLVYCSGALSFWCPRFKNHYARAIGDALLEQHVAATCLPLK